MQRFAARKKPAAAGFFRLDDYMFRPWRRSMIHLIELGRVFAKTRESQSVQSRWHRQET
jgi:hypothetical protein